MLKKGWGRAWSRKVLAGASPWQARKASSQSGAKDSHEAAVDEAGGMGPRGQLRRRT